MTERWLIENDKPGVGRWSKIVFSGQLKIKNDQLGMGDGRWAMGDGRWSMVDGRN